MDTESKGNDKQNIEIPESGIYVRGVVVSSSARFGRRKDNTGSYVVVAHELAVRPGIVVWTEWYDPAKDLEVKVEGDNVVSYPKPKEFAPIVLKVERIERRNDVVQVSKAVRLS